MQFSQGPRQDFAHFVVRDLDNVRISVCNRISKTRTHTPAIMSLPFFSRLLRLPASVRPFAQLSISRSFQHLSVPTTRTFSTTPIHSATLNQVIRGCRQGQKARRARSPAIVGRPEMKGVCVRVGITKPKKPNSGERKVARVRLSSGTIITAYIPGEGEEFL